MAKFKVGDRVRIVKVLTDRNGKCGTVYRIEEAVLGWTDATIQAGVKQGERGYFVDVDGLGKRDAEGLYCYAEWQLEPIIDQSIKDKVAQLVKQCMPVAA